MAHFDKQSGTIILSEDDKDCLREAQANMNGKRTPIADSIIKKILPEALSSKEEF